MQYKVGDEVILKTDPNSYSARYNGARAKITDVFSTCYNATCVLGGVNLKITMADSDIAGPAESEKQRAMARLYCLIAEINSKEITYRIAYDMLSRWCNDWRVAAKEALQALGED